MQALTCLAGSGRIRRWRRMLTTIMCRPSSCSSSWQAVWASWSGWSWANFAKNAACPSTRRSCWQFSAILLGRRRGAAFVLMEWSNPGHHGRAVGSGQGDGVALPVGIHPYCGYEHHRPRGLQPRQQAADERVAVHRCGTGFDGRRRQGDDLCCADPDHPQRGTGPRRLRDRRATTSSPRPFTAH